MIQRRAELIAYYERRSYVRTGETRPFPFEVKPAGATFELVVMAREIL